MQETWLQFLGQEDPLEKGMATHFSILPGESCGQRRLVGYYPWGHKESDMLVGLTVLVNPTNCSPPDLIEADLTEVDKIRRRLQEYIEELYKKGFNDPDTHDGVITHLESDVLVYEVKWALGTVTMNKASEGDGITAELFQIINDDVVKVLCSICQEILKTQ